MAKKIPHVVDQGVGAQIRKARMMAQKSQEDLGEALGLTFQQVQKYEKGTNRVSASRLSEIAAIFGKPIEWFFAGATTPAEVLQVGEADPLIEQSQSAAGIALARAFRAITDPETRRLLVAVAENFAEPFQVHIVERKKSA